MKAIINIEVDLDVAEEKSDMQNMLNWRGYAHVIHSIATHIRSKIKYTELSAERLAAYEEMQELLNCECLDAGIEY